MSRVALLGWPVGHSVSPAMHNAAFAASGLSWRYEAVRTPPEALRSTVERLRAEGYAGANVTIPHKQAVMELAAAASEDALRIGAANTLLFREDGVHAHNTDVAGFLAAWDAAFGRASLFDARVVVLGAGGAARAVVAAAARAQAQALIVLNRDEVRAERLLEELAPVVPGLTSVAMPLTTESLALVLRPGTAVVNCTSVGTAPATGESPVDWPGSFAQYASLRVMDVVYNPRPSRFLREASARGARTCDGLGMLVEQGAASYALWTGREAPRPVMRAAAEAALQEGETALP